MLTDGEAGTIARSIIAKALAGNAVAARFIVGRLMAPPRDRPLDLPEGGVVGEGEESREGRRIPLSPRGPFDKRSGGSG
jgi:hypothetical protein